MACCCRTKELFYRSGVLNPTVGWRNIAVALIDL
jgi:hypothetical protein